MFIAFAVTMGETFVCGIELPAFWTINGIAPLRWLEASHETHAIAGVGPRQCARVRARRKHPRAAMVL
jgi:hypothetical protein